MYSITNGTGKSKIHWQTKDEPGNKGYLRDIRLYFGRDYVGRDYDMLGAFDADYHRKHSTWCLKNTLSDERIASMQKKYHMHMQVSSNCFDGSRKHSCWLEITQPEKNKKWAFL